MLKKLPTILALGIAGFFASIAIAPDVRADRKQECYMINSEGQYLNLSSICYATPPQTVNVINNNSATPQPREVYYPRYDVRTYYDYGSHQNRSIETTRPYFNSYRYYSQPVFVPVPHSGYYRNYYNPGANLGIGYSNGRFGLGFGYNSAPRYRGYYHRSYRNNYRRGYRNNYNGTYRDGHGRYNYNRNGMKIRYR